MGCWGGKGGGPVEGREGGRDSGRKVLVEDGEAAVKELYFVNAGRKRKGIQPQLVPSAPFTNQQRYNTHQLFPLRLTQ